MKKKTIQTPSVIIRTVCSPFLNFAKPSGRCTQAGYSIVTGTEELT